MLQHVALLFTKPSLDPLLALAGLGPAFNAAVMIGIKKAAVFPPQCLHQGQQK